MEGRQVGSYPKDALEIFPLVVEHKGKILVDLTVEIDGEHKSTVFLVLSDRLEDVENFLKSIMQSIMSVLAKITL